MIFEQLNERQMIQPLRKKRFPGVQFSEMYYNQNDDENCKQTKILDHPSEEQQNKKVHKQDGFIYVQQEQNKQITNQKQLLEEQFCVQNFPLKPTQNIEKQNQQQNPIYEFEEQKDEEFRYFKVDEIDYLNEMDDYVQKQWIKKKQANQNGVIKKINKYQMIKSQ